ncbi:MAG: hypothetical protein PVF56_20005 [Desulfobacterales bacterium]|jgi:hypothetical protein
MSKVAAIIFLFVCFGLTPWATAGDFDGSKPVLVSVARILECTRVEGCRDVSADSVGLPQFLKIDFAKKTIRPNQSEEDIPDTTIERSERVDGKLILQGAEDGYEKMRDGLGWTLAIAEDSGQVVLTASGDQVAFVVFGAAIPF